MRSGATTIAVVALSCAACDGKGDSPYFESRSPVTVIDTVPAPGEAEVSIEPLLEVEFSGEIDPQRISGAIDLVELPAELPVAVTVSYVGRVARITTAKLDLATRYRASVIGLRDDRGRPMDDHAWEFETVDPPALQLAYTLPPPGAVTPGNFVVRAVFTVPLDPALLAATPMRVNGGAVGGGTTYDAAGQTLTFRPNAPADGAMSVSLSPVFDVYGRSYAPPGWSFTADAATVDAARPTLPGAVTAVESSAGTITVSFGAALDDQWSGDDIRYEALLTRLKPPAPAGCLDPFEPQAVRRAVYGSGGTISVSKLQGGTWSVLVEAEDGSGRRSVPKPAAQTVTLSADAPTFATTTGPLLTERCALTGCHAGSHPPGYVDYTASRDEIVAHVSRLDLPLVTPFCLERSYLWRKLTPGYEIEGQLMPPDAVYASSLSRRERELFRRWILEQGGN